MALCAGYGGLEEGLRLAGLPVRTVCFVEREAYAAANLVSLMDSGRLAPAPIWDDLRTFDPSEWGPFVSCVSAGFPCGPFSQGGHKAYTDDPRWLWPDIDRILRCLLPSVVFLENVRGLASGTRPGIEHVLGTMAALGYDARWGMLRADDPLVGATHRRERWFCVAWLADSKDRWQRRDARELEAQSRAGEKYAGITRGAGDALGRCRELADASCSDLRSVSRGIRRPTRAAENHRQERQRSGPAAGCGSAASVADSHGTEQQPPNRINTGMGRIGRKQDPPIRPSAGKGQTESGMGGGPHGIPRGLDAHRWPAPPGPQHPWEPPRTRPRQPHDRDRLKALGNSVVPHCGAVIGRFIGGHLL